MTHTSTEPSGLKAYFWPKLFSCLKNYSRQTFLSDLSSGVVVGIVALPLAIAFAIASGVSPDRGLTTAIIAGFLISFLGGSRVQIGGPTGAFVVIVYGIVEQYGLNGLLISTFISGIFLILMGVLRLGFIIKFIPYPLTVGFTSGIAVVIFSSQVKDFLGLKTKSLPGDFIEKWDVIIKALHTTDGATVAVFVGALLVLVLARRLSKKIPASLVAILLGTLAVHLFAIPVETIGSRFGSIPSGLSHPVWPKLNFAVIQKLISPGMTIAILGAIESLLSASVADGLISGRHRSNTELIAQGVANLVTPIFGGIPATGAIARTVTNVKNGGKTPVAGLIHALTLLIIVLLFGRWAKEIPLAVLAAILVVVAYNMSEWRAWIKLIKGPRMDVLVLLTSFVLTVLVDLTVAVEVGLLLAVLLFMKRMTDVTTVREISREITREMSAEKETHHDTDALIHRSVPDGVRIYEVEGAFFFGSAAFLRDRINVAKNKPRVLILQTRHMLALDATGLSVLSDLNQQCKKQGTRLMIAGIHAQPMVALEQSGLLYEIGMENIMVSLDRALDEISAETSSHEQLTIPFG